MNFLDFKDILDVVVFHVTDKNIVMMIDGSDGITWMEKVKPVVADFYRERLEIEGLFCLPFYKKILIDC